MKVVKVPIDSVRLDPKNARKHGKRNLATIKASLEAFGQRKPIVLDRDGTVVAGNGTLIAARELGWGEIWVERSELTGDDATAYALADNRTAELATWDKDVLAGALEGLKNFKIDMSAFGFDALKGDGEPDGDTKGDMKSMFEVVVECASENSQRAVYERLTKEGLKCRVLSM